MQYDTAKKTVQLQELFPWNVMEDIKEAYLEDERPWIIGFSGGKDSSCLMQLIYYTLVRLPKEQRKKHIYVLASDTRVETPLITKRVRKELKSIEVSAERDELPLSTHLVYPALNDTFWVNLIGRGYPSPTNHFRWCTDRLKIKPISAFIQKVVSKTGEVIVVLGARKDESSTRAQTMKRSEIEGNRYRPHTELQKAWVYTPIEKISTNEVWTYLLQVPNPWSGKNRELVSLYKNASGECPLVIDTSTPSCGHSRFGCWTCTVVDKDKSVESLVNSGEDNLLPLLQLRNFLKEVRELPGSRYNNRRNGTIPLRRVTNEKMTNTGPFRHSTRIDILKKVLIAQIESGITLIEGDELSFIQEIWTKEENDNLEKPVIPSDLVYQIWNKIAEGSKMAEAIDNYDHLSEEEKVLKKVCESNNISFELMRKLRDIEEEYVNLKRRQGLPEDMRELFRSYILKEER